MRVEMEESAQVDAETNTFGEAPEEAQDARKRFEERAVLGLEQLRSDSELSGELNAALAQAVGPLTPAGWAYCNFTYDFGPVFYAFASQMTTRRFAAGDGFDVVRRRAAGVNGS